MSKRHSWVAVIAGLSATCLLLLAWEFYLHVRYPSPFSAYVRDGELEYRIRWLDSARPGTIDLRGRLHTIAKPSGTIRILALGGSTTNGHQISGWENVWPAKLEAQLRLEGLNAEVLNAADLGYSCEHVRRVANRLVPLLQPDTVIFMEGWNWPGIAEPLNWSPFPRLPAGLRWLNPVVDSRLFADIRNRTVRFMGEQGGWHGMVEPDAYRRIKDEHRSRLGRCVAALDSELAALNAAHVMVIPPSFLAVDDATADGLAAYEGMLWMFNYCRTRDMKDIIHCHLNDRKAMRDGLSDSLKGHYLWKAVIDGERFASSGWEERSRLFMDHMHLTVEGNDRFGRFIASELMQSGLKPHPAERPGLHAE